MTKTATSCFYHCLSELEQIIFRDKSQMLLGDGGIFGQVCKGCSLRGRQILTYFSLFGTVGYQDL